MQDELVQDDDPGAPTECIDDPAVGVRIVADVVERDVGRRITPSRHRNDDLLDPLAQCGEKQRRVVGDPRPRRRERRVVGDLHA